MQTLVLSYHHMGPRDLVVSLDSKSFNLLRYLPGPVYLFPTGSCCVAQPDLKLEAIVLPKALEYP